MKSGLFCDRSRCKIAALERIRYSSSLTNLTGECGFSIGGRYLVTAMLLISVAERCVMQLCDNTGMSTHLFCLRSGKKISNISNLWRAAAKRSLVFFVESVNSLFCKMSKMVTHACHKSNWKINSQKSQIIQFIKTCSCN